MDWDEQFGFAVCFLRRRFDPGNWLARAVEPGYPLLKRGNDRGDGFPLVVGGRLKAF